MRYRSFPGTDKPVSLLGFGTMRLPMDENGNIVEDEAIRMIRHAIDSGVNYVDTALFYHKGESERLVAKALKDGYREKVFLVTKLPPWHVNEPADMERILNEQLEKLETTYLDCYLLHAMNATSLEKMTNFGYKAFLEKAKADGKIRAVGFSFHDNFEAFKTILNDYDWQLCQVQMNLLDVNTQATVEGIRMAGEKGVGVVIMEPLRGGLLAKPAAEIQTLYDTFPVKRSAVEWAFRFLYAMPEVTTILSGMSTMEQVENNLAIFSRGEGEATTEEEAKLYHDVREAYLSRVKTRCTACSYCQPCPMGVKIPSIFTEYDRDLLHGDHNFAKEYGELVAVEKDASRCVACGQCESKCPQHLPIIRYLQEIHQEWKAGDQA